MKNLLIVAILVIGFSCTRKVHTEKVEDWSSQMQMQYIDSINKVNRAWSQAYEELLKTTNSTGVVFESQPCDTAKITGKPTVTNKITVAPDGTKTFEGNIKSYKADAAMFQKTIFSQQETIDSLMRVKKKDTSHHEQSSVVVIRNVKSSFIPIWMWVILAILFVLWVNERFSLFKIPFLTRTSLFTKT